jgi:hypothetical protein
MERLLQRLAALVWRRPDLHDAADPACEQIAANLNLSPAEVHSAYTLIVVSNAMHKYRTRARVSARRT